MAMELAAQLFFLLGLHARIVSRCSTSFDLRVYALQKHRETFLLGAIDEVVVCGLERGLLFFEDGELRVAGAGHAATFVWTDHAGSDDDAVDPIHGCG